MLKISLTEAERIGDGTGHVEIAVAIVADRLIDLLTLAEDSAVGFPDQFGVIDIRFVFRES